MTWYLLPVLCSPVCQSVCMSLLYVCVYYVEPPVLKINGSVFMYVAVFVPYMHVCRSELSNQLCLSVCHSLSIGKSQNPLSGS